MTLTPFASARNAYARDAVLSATPARLLTMLYDRLLLDLERAAIAQDAGDHAAASAQLLHAQDIVAELHASLRPDLWSGGPGLQALYTYVTTRLVEANVQRDATRTRECIALLEPLRQAWHEAAATPSSAPVPHSA